MSVVCRFKSSIIESIIDHPDEGENCTNENKNCELSELSHFWHKHKRARSKASWKNVAITNKLIFITVECKAVLFLVQIQIRYREEMSAF